MKRAYILVAICIILISVIVLSILISHEGFSNILPLEAEEKYRILTDELVPREEISLFLVTEELIFVYFDYNGIINIYTQDGIFLYGLQIDSLKNGVGDIAFREGILYIKARGNMIYLFKETVLVDNFRRQENPDTYKEIELLMDGEPCHQINNVKFFSSNNQIMKISEGNAIQPVISLPQKNMDIHYLAIFVLLSIAALMHYLRISVSR